MAIIKFGHEDTKVKMSFDTGQRVEGIFALAILAVEQNRRRITTSVVNEVLSEALRWRSPPTSRGGRQGRLYYCTQVAINPPSFTLFVNDPKLFFFDFNPSGYNSSISGLNKMSQPVLLSFFLSMFNVSGYFLKSLIL